MIAAALLAASFAAQCPDGSPPPCGGRAARDPAASASVAVMSFENLSRDTTDAYLVDGITEEVTNRLGDVSRLRVVGRGVVRRAQRDAGGDAMAVGRALNVRYVVEGSLRRAGTRVRISARLLRASDGVRVWGDDYDRTMDDLLSMQVDIAREVAGNVAGQLLPGEQQRLVRRPTANAAAWDHFLRGRFLQVRRTEAAIQQAAAQYETALRLDPRFAAAHARLSNTYALAWGYDVPLGDSLPERARRAAERALALDSMSSDAWLAIGVVRNWFPPVDVFASRAALERAVSLDPRNAEATHTLGHNLQVFVEDAEASIAAFQRALAIDPTRAVTLLDIAQVRFAQHRSREARVLVDSALSLEPGQARLHLMSASLHRAAGDFVASRRAADIGYRIATPSIRRQALAQLIGLDVHDGDTVMARARLEEMKPTGAREPFLLALALAYLGMNDSASAVLLRGPIIPPDWSYLNMPEYDPLRALPVWRRVVQVWLPRRSL